MMFMSIQALISRLRLPFDDILQPSRLRHCSSLSSIVIAETLGVLAWNGKQLHALCIWVASLHIAQDSNCVV
jgi:hypothetical protein